VLVAFYALSALVLVLVEEAWMRSPPKSETVRGSGRDLWLTTQDGARIYACHYERDPALPTLLYLHGGAGTLQTRADRLELFASLGANLLAVEYRGYGPNEGTPLERNVELDALAGYEWLLQRTSAHRMVAFGESFGGGPATWLAVNRKVGGLILLSTGTSVPALAASFMPWFPTRWIVRMRFDTLARIAHVSAPKLFIHSRADGIVPFAMARTLYDRAPAPKQHLWLEDIGHDDTFYLARETATAAMRTFLASLPE
jgi:fermentation-respiration switch protein FrsA (DUF1100 family)